MINVIPRTMTLKELILYRRQKEGMTPPNMTPVSTCTGVAVVNLQDELRLKMDHNPVRCCTSMQTSNNSFSIPGKVCLDGKSTERLHFKRLPLTFSSPPGPHGGS